MKSIGFIEFLLIILDFIERNFTLFTSGKRKGYATNTRSKI